MRVRGRSVPSRSCGRTTWATWRSRALRSRRLPPRRAPPPSAPAAWTPVYKQSCKPCAQQKQSTLGKRAAMLKARNLVLQLAPEAVRSAGTFARAYCLLASASMSLHELVVACKACTLALCKKRPRIPAGSTSTAQPPRQANATNSVGGSLKTSTISKADMRRFVALLTSSAANSHKPDSQTDL